jgi:acetyl esterase
MTDYNTLIDAETWAFIRRTDAWYPPDAVTRTVAEQRAVYDAMCSEFFAGYPEGVSAETTAIALPDRSVPIRIYRTRAPEAAALVLYFHGGGFVLGGLASHDDVCAELADRTGYEVVSVDYRLSPEHVHPAHFDDALAAFEWAATTYKRPILLCGDSAGGTLAAAVSHATRGHSRRPIGQVLIYPSLGGDGSRGSYVTHAEAPMLTTRDLDFYRGIRAGEREVTGDITFSPLADADFANLPPTVILTAECDPLSSDGEAYRDRVVAAGGKVLWIEEKGLVHGYLRARHSVVRARESFSRIVEALSKLGRGEFPALA